MARSNAARARDTSPRPSKAPEAPLADLDRLIHERMRLGIVSALAPTRR